MNLSEMHNNALHIMRQLYRMSRYDSVRRRRRGFPAEHSHGAALGSPEVLECRRLLSGNDPVASIVPITPTGIEQPRAVAVDHAGNVYIAGGGSNEVKEWHSGTHTLTTLFTMPYGLFPYGMAVDESGDVYTYSSDRLIEWNIATGAITFFPDIIVSTGGIAIDNIGNIWFPSYYGVWEWHADSATFALAFAYTPGVGTVMGVTVAVDRSGNVFFVDSSDYNAIKEWHPTTNTITTVVSSGHFESTGIAVDKSGNVYFAGNDGISEWHVNTNTVTNLVHSGGAPMAVDDADNVFFADSHGLYEVVKGGYNISTPNAPSQFSWDSVESGGGFTFSYNITGAGVVGTAIPDTTIAFSWDHLSLFDFPLTASGKDNAGQSLTNVGTHTVTLTDQQIRALGATLALSTDLPPRDYPNLVMDIDPNNLISETNESDNEASLKDAPLVVNVLTHGWNSSAAEWFGYGETLNNMPAPGSTLEGRVASYLANWDSNTGFTVAFLALAASMAYEDNEVASLALKVLASDEAQTSRDLANFEAWKIVSDLITGGYLPPPDQSNSFQHIELIGHSRGAAVNALVSQRLAAAGYKNVDYIGLDGFSTDWPDGAGIIGDTSIDNAIANTKVNVEVQVGLGGIPEAIRDQWLYSLTSQIPLIPPDVSLKFIQTTFPSSILGTELNIGFRNVKAPSRAASGFVDILADQAPGQLSDHINITQMYFDPSQFGITSPIYADPRAPLYEYQHAKDGTTATMSPQLHSVATEAVWGGTNSVSPTATVAELPETDPAPTSTGISLGFTDGAFEQLGGLLAQNVHVSTGDPIVDYFGNMLSDPVALLAALWQVTGSAKLVQSNRNTAVDLKADAGAASIGQFINVPADPESLTFDLGVMSADAGDTLQVLYNDDVIDTIDLATRTTSGTVSVPLNSITTGGLFSFVLSGSFAAEITLDDLAVSNGNHAPVLNATSPMLPPTIARDTSGGNAGVAVSTLVSGITDEDEDNLKGIIVTASDTQDGGLQFSLDSGNTWNNVGLLSDTNGLLLDVAAGTRIRYVANSNVNGMLSSIFSFRAWDQTTGALGAPGIDFDASINGGSSSFSTLIDTASLIVNVIDVNQTPEVVSATFSLAENSALNTAVGIVTASDPDAGQTLTFNIISGNVAGAFAINPTTGALTVVNSEALDFVAHSSLTLTVGATDNGTPQLQGTGVITIDLVPDVQNVSLSGGSGSVTYLKTGSAVKLLPNIVIEDNEEISNLSQVKISAFVQKKGRLSDYNLGSLTSLGTVTQSGASTFKKAGGTHNVTITLNPGVTDSEVQQALREITFKTKKFDPKNKSLGRKVEVQVIDGRGIASNKITTAIVARKKWALG